MTSAKNSSRRSAQASGNSGSCAGQSDVRGDGEPLRRCGEPARPGPRARMPGPTPVPADRGRERPRLRVGVGEPVEVRVRRGVRGAGPVRPEVLEVGADGVPVAVQEPVGQLEPVEVLVPELPQDVGVEQALPGAGHGWGHHQSAHALRERAGDGLGDAAADVVPRQHDGPEPQLVQQSRHAARLRVAGVPLVGRHGVLVRLPEPPQVRHDDVGRVGQQRRDQPVVGAAAGPPVQEHHRRPARRCGRRRGRNRRRGSCAPRRQPSDAAGTASRGGAPAGPGGNVLTTTCGRALAAA